MKTTNNPATPLPIDAYAAALKADLADHQSATPLDLAPFYQPSTPTREQVDNLVVAYLSQRADHARLGEALRSINADRAKLVEALLESADDANRAGGSKADLNSILDAISLRARSVLIELGEDA